MGSGAGSDSGLGVDSGFVKGPMSGTNSGSEAGSPPAPGLWYASSGVCEFTHAQLQASANTNPQIVVTSPALGVAYDVALDANGNAWAVGSGSDNVFRFPAAALTTSGSVQADLVIHSAALKSPGNLTFDASGALWVANRPLLDAGTMDGSIVRFDNPSALSGMQDLSPTVRITSAKAGDLFEIGSIALDASQNLWVTSFAGMMRFDNPGSQSGDVALTPAAVIDKTGYSNDIYFYSIAFDASGSLWAASGDGFHYLTSVTEFKNPGSFQGRSSPPAAATIQGAADQLPAGGLAFDGDGNLWMATVNAFVNYSAPGNLSGNVNPTPAISIKVMGAAAPTTNAHLVLFPPPALAQDAGSSNSGTDAGTDTGVSGVGTSTGTFTFSNVVGSNVDSMPLSSEPCCGSAQQSGSGAASLLILDFGASGANGTKGRNVACKLSGPFLAGATYMLSNTGTPASECTYTEPSGSPLDTQWISNGGTLTIDSMTGRGFTFTLHAATMVVNAAITSNPATGTFTMTGTGTGTLP
jgi:hypothetical protein